MSPFLLLLFAATVLTVNGRESLALHKPAQQSTLHTWGTPDKAVDGVKDMSYTAGSCTHTNKQFPEWWMVDLLKVHYVTSVRITNRDDCCAQRLQNFTVEVSIKDPKDLVGFPGLTKSRPCIENVSEIPGYETEYFCARPMVGRYVRLIKYGNEQLSICEFEVFGSTVRRFEKLPIFRPPLTVIDPMTRNVLECARLCLRSTNPPECQFIQWNRHNQTCQLLPSLSDDKSQMKRENIWRFYKLSSN